MVWRIKNYFAHRNGYSETSIIAIFNPFFVFMFLFGLFPHTTTTPEGEDADYAVLKIKTLSVTCAYTFAFLLITLVITCIVTVLVDVKNDPIIYSMSKINYFIEEAILLIIYIVSYLWMFKNRNVYLNLFNEVASIWFILGNSNAGPILKHFQFVIYFSLGCVFGTMIVQIICFHIENEEVWTYTTYILPELIPSFMVVLYMVTGYMVVCLFKNIKQCCLEIGAVKKNAIYSFVIVRSTRSRNTLQELETAYKKTMGVKRDIIRIFQIPVLVIVVQAFHTLVGEAHYLYHVLAISRQYTAIEILRQLLYIWIHTSKICFLSIPGTLMKQEETKIGQALHSIAVEDLKTFAEIQNFSSVMAYQESEMTACGYFALDASLLFNTLAAVTTYSFILIQFDNKDNSAKNHK